MSDLGKTKGMINMENAILEMQQNLADGFFIAFMCADGECFTSLKKSDDIKFLDEKTALIKRESGRHSIINLDWIVEISIMRGLFQ